MTVKVIYIIGAAYSGSTVLGAILGLNPHLVDAGELQMRTVSPAHPTKALCSCGEPVGQCPFWLRVYAEFTESFPVTDMDAYRSRMERYQHFRSFPRLMGAAAFPGSDFSTFQREAVGMIESVARASGKPAIVDVSKAPMRALALATIPQVDLRLIHLVRDGLAHIASVYKHHGKKWSRQGSSPRDINIRATRSWLFANLGAEFVARTSRRPAMRVRYEDLLSDPQRFIESLNEVTGENLEEVARHVAKGEPIDFGHSGGNIAGRGGPRPLIASEEWRQQVAPEGKKLFDLRAGWLNHLYGY